MTKIPTEAEMEGMAPIELLQSLHGLLGEELVRVMKRPKVSAANMATARAYLLQNSLALEPIKPGSAMAKRLEVLRSQYVKRLSEQVLGDKAPTASMFGEIRLFLASEGILKGGTVAPRLSPVDLEDLELPFNTPQQ